VLDFVMGAEGKVLKGVLGGADERLSEADMVN